MKNGKVSQFLKDHWRGLVCVAAVSFGILCGVWSCSKHPAIDVDANRNRIVIQLNKFKSNPNK